MEVGVVEVVVGPPLHLLWWVLMGQGEEPPCCACLMAVGVVACCGRAPGRSPPVLRRVAPAEGVGAGPPDLMEAEVAGLHVLEVDWGSGPHAAVDLVGVAEGRSDLEGAEGLG